MTIDRLALAGGALAVLIAVTAGCSDSGTSQSAPTAAEEQTGEDRTITGATEADPEIDRDPTPQTGTGGSIPGAKEPAQ